MKRFTIEVLAALAAAGVAGAAFAGGKGGAGAGVGAAAGVGANAGVNAGASAGANPGGNAGAHVSPQGSANSNGQFQTDRQFGLDRAQERMSEQGLEHQKATTAPAERRGPKAGAETSGSAKAGAGTR